MTESAPKKRHPVRRFFLGLLATVVVLVLLLHLALWLVLRHPTVRAAVLDRIAAVAHCRIDFDSLHARLFPARLSITRLTLALPESPSTPFLTVPRLVVEGSLRRRAVTALRIVSPVVDLDPLLAAAPAAPSAPPSGGKPSKPTAPKPAPETSPLPANLSLDRLDVVDATLRWTATNGTPASLPHVYLSAVDLAPTAPLRLNLSVLTANPDSSLALALNAASPDDLLLHPADCPLRCRLDATLADPASDLAPLALPLPSPFPFAHPSGWVNLIGNTANGFTLEASFTDALPHQSPTTSIAVSGRLHPTPDSPIPFSATATCTSPVLTLPTLAVRNLAADLQYAHPSLSVPSATCSIFDGTATLRDASLDLADPAALHITVPTASLSEAAVPPLLAAVPAASNCPAIDGRLTLSAALAATLRDGALDPDTLSVANGALSLRETRIPLPSALSSLLPSLPVFTSLTSQFDATATNVVLHALDLNSDLVTLAAHGTIPLNPPSWNLNATVSLPGMSAPVPASIVGPLYFPDIRLDNRTIASLSSLTALLTPSDASSTDSPDAAPETSVLSEAIAEPLSKLHTKDRRNAEAALSLIGSFLNK